MLHPKSACNNNLSFKVKIATWWNDKACRHSRYTCHLLSKVHDFLLRLSGHLYLDMSVCDFTYNTK